MNALRMGALALVALMLVTACATGAPMGAAYRYRAPEGHDSLEAGTLGSQANDDLGETAFTRLPTDFAPVQVSESDVTAALTTLWLNTPLRVAATSRSPLYVGRKLALASAPSSDKAWRSDLAQSYGHYCKRCGTPGDCLTLFEDGPLFQDDDKRRLALALAVGPALEGVDAEVRALLNPTQW